MIERLRAQSGTSIDARQARQLGILDAALGQLIERSLLDQEAQRLGLEVSDETIRGAIYDNPGFRGPDGKFDRSLFAQALMANRLSEDQLVERLRHDIPRSDLLQAITAGVGAPRPVVDALYLYRNEKRVADIVAFPVAAVTDIGTPSDADLSQFHDSHPELFRAPEYRGIILASLSPSDLEPATSRITSCARNTTSARTSSRHPSAAKSSKSSLPPKKRPRKPRPLSHPARIGMRSLPRSPSRSRTPSTSAC